MDQANRTTLETILRIVGVDQAVAIIFQEISLFPELTVRETSSWVTRS